MSQRSGTLRHFAIIKNGTTPASGESTYWDGEIAWATPDDLGRLQGLSVSETKRTVTQLAVVENNLNLVPPDTVLMSTRAPIGHMAITTRPMTFNQGCRALVPREGTWGPFLFYLLKSRVPELNASANGTTFVELSRDDLAEVRISLPPLETQKRIAAFLDAKTAQIDGLIEKKRALLQRLTEKRQAIITQAVTKGLNPAAPMRHSGIDWLGQIPAHWEVVALNKVTTKITNGYVGPTRDLFVNEGIRYLQSLHIKGNRIIFGEDFFVEKEWSDQHSKSILKAGDVLIVQTGDIGQVACVTPEYEGCNCHALIICSPTLERLDGRYLAWLLNSDYGQEFLHMVKTGALHPHLNCGNVKFFNVLIPSVSEQQLIADFIDSQRGRLEIATERVRVSVHRLTEYRSALITAAVTGQIEGLG